MSTKILGNEELNILRAKTPYSLPDNPSDKGFNARQIKTKFWEGYLLLFNWLKETQASLNNDFATTNSALLNESKRIDVILTYFSNGKANFAVRDRNNNIIDETYELKSEASSKFNQLIADIQSVSSASGNKITGTQNINADGIQYTITLSNTQNATLSTITQYLPLATTLKAGLLSSTDKEKINNIESDLTNFLANAKAYTDEKLQRDNIVNILGAASHTLIGLLTSEDKKKIDALYSLLGEAEDADTVVNTINEVLAIFSSYPEGVDIVSQLEKKVNYTDVINTLDSEETSKPLSAKMGKELKTEVDTKAELAYVNEELDKKALKSDILVIDEAVTAQESEITTTQNEGDKLVDEIVGYVDGSPRGVYASLSALQSAFPSGTQGVYLTSDNGHWNYYNNGWKDGGVYQTDQSYTEVKNDLVDLTSKIVIGKNLFNPNDPDIVVGKFINADGTTYTANNAYNTTGFIDVTNISQFVASSKSGMGQVGVNVRSFAFYDDEKNPISGGQASASLTEYQNVVDGAKYVRIGYSNTAVEYQIESGIIKSSYEPFHEVIYANNDVDLSRKEKILRWQLGTLDTNNGSVVQTNTKIVTGSLIKFSSGDILSVDVSQINVIVCFYNSDGTFTNKYIQLNSVGNSVLEFTEDTYVRVRIGYNDNRTISNFNNILNYASITSNPNYIKPSRWNGKKALIFGMSITFGYQLFDANWTQSLDTSTPSNYCYMKEVCSRLRMTLKNMSCPGGTLAESSTSTDRYPLVNRWNDVDGNYDLILIDCISNDFQYAWTPFGEWHEIGYSHNKNTFIGAMQIVCEGLMHKYPNAKIMWITPLKRYQSGLYGRKANAIGKTLEDYSNAIKDICEYYGLEVIDVNSESGINPMIDSDRQYFNEETEASGKFYTHLNLYGHNKIADFVESKLK